MRFTSVVMSFLILQEGFAGRASDLEALQGTWVAEVRTPLQNRTMTVRMTIQGTSVRWSAPDLVSKVERVHTATLALDEQPDPKHWSLTGFQSSEGLQPLPDMHAIYRIEGDSLVLCVPRSPKAARPTEILADSGQGPIQTVSFTRER